MTILTVQEAAEFLRMTPSQIYSMCKKRGRERMAKPLPVLRVNSNIRFVKESLEAWLKELEAES